MVQLSTPWVTPNRGMGPREALFVKLLWPLVKFSTRSYTRSYQHSSFVSVQLWRFRVSSVYIPGDLRHVIPNTVHSELVYSAVPTLFLFYTDYRCLCIYLSNFCVVDFVSFNKLLIKFDSITCQNSLSVRPQPFQCLLSYLRAIEI